MPEQNVFAIMFGPPGSGKDTMIRKFGVKAYAITPDVIRLMYGIPVWRDGSWGIPQGNPKVWDLTTHLIHSRLSLGFPTILNATGCDLNSLQNYRKFTEYGARMLLVDCKLRDDLYKRNTYRPMIEQVPERVIDRMMNGYRSVWKEIENPTGALEFLEVVNDLSEFVRVLKARGLFCDVSGADAK